MKQSLRILSIVLLSTTLVACASDRKKDMNDTSLTNESGVEGGMMEDGTIYGSGAPIYTGNVDDLPAGSQQQLVALIGDRIFFGFNATSLSVDAKKTLGRQADWLNENSNVSITIEGHADERGTREYNLALGEKRANSVKNFLVSKGISSSRLTVISYGKEHPEFPNSDEASWSKNRRAVTVVN